MRVTGFVAVRKDRGGHGEEWIDFSTFHRVGAVVQESVRRLQGTASHVESPVIRIDPAFIETVAVPEPPIEKKPQPPLEEPVNVDELAANIIGNPWP